MIVKFVNVLSLLVLTSLYLYKTPVSPLFAQSAPVPLVWEALNSGLTPHFQVTATAADPRDATHLFATLYAPTGLLESWDSGRSWQPVVLAGQPQLPLVTLLFNPQQSNQLLLGGPDGLFQLTLGAERSVLADRVQPVVGWPVALPIFALHGAADGTIYAAAATAYGTLPTLWSSRDGASWQASTPLPPPATTGTAILSVLHTASGLFVGTDGAGLFMQHNGASAWQPVAAIGETFVAALWAAPWDERLLLARTRAGLFRSVDGGANWVPSTLPVDVRVDSIAAFAGHTILLGLADGTLLRSFDQGASWLAWGSSLGRDGLFYTLGVIPETGVNLLAGTQHGLYRSIDSGVTWQQVQLRNPLATFFPTQALAQSADGTLYLGGGDGVYRSQNGGENWHAASIALPKKAVLALAIGGDQADLLFAGSEAGVFRLARGGSHWQTLGWTGSVPGFALAPQDPNRLYLRAADERIYSTNQAQSEQPDAVTWTQQGRGMALTSEILSLAIDPTNDQVLYAGGATELFKSTYGAQQWQPIGTALAGQSIFALLVDAHAPQKIYAGATNGLYQSRDGGAVWQRLGVSLADVTVSALARHPSNADLLFAGTKLQGLWYSRDKGLTWQQVDVLRDATIYTLLVAIDGQWIFAATDHGFWRARLPASGRLSGGDVSTPTGNPRSDVDRRNAD